MTKEEALEEITRLQKFVAEKSIPKPEPLDNPNFGYLVSLAMEHISDLDKDGFADEESDHWFYEAVMEAVYGKDVWAWINANSK
mgnify:CR=1 FL=1